MEKILRKRKVLKRKGRFSHNECLVTWKDYPIKETMWESESTFLCEAILHDNLMENQQAEFDPREL